MRSITLSNNRLIAQATLWPVAALVSMYAKLKHKDLFWLRFDDCFSDAKLVPVRQELYSW